MSRRVMVAVGLVAVILAGIAGPLPGEWRNTRGGGAHRPDPPAAVLTLDPRDLDFGEAWETDRFRWVVRVRNTSEKAVHIERVGASCGCTGVTPQQLTLDPAATADLSLAIDLTANPDPSGEFAVRLTVEPADPATGRALPPAVAVVQGRRRPVFRIAPVHFLGRYSRATPPGGPWTVPFTSAVPLDRVSASASGSFERAEVTPTDPAGTAFVARVWPRGPLPLGEFGGELALRPHRGGEAVPDRRTRLSGAVVPDVEAEPPTVSGGGRAAGESFEYPVRLQSLSGQPFQVVRFETTTPDLTIRPAGAEYVLSRACGPAAPAASQAIFHVEAKDGTYAVTVPVDYTLAADRGP
ncbi:MAG: DUF1573 domain-containing protein [Gemmataceae bacterium]|nr:DUF1573 domain-containing protein [Gemmataceae bacterium]